MEQERKIFGIERKHWMKSTDWALLNIVLGLLPTWLTIILLPALFLPIGLGTLTERGEFALYAAGLVTTSIFVVTRGHKSELIRQRISGAVDRSVVGRIGLQIPGAGIFGIFLAFLLAVASVLFAAATIGVSHGSGHPSNNLYITVTTIVLYIIAFILSYMVTVLGNLTITIASAQEKKEQEVTNLGNKLDERIKSQESQGVGPA